MLRLFDARGRADCACVCVLSAVSALCLFLDTYLSSLTYIIAFSVDYTALRSTIYTHTHTHNSVWHSLCYLTVIIAHVLTPPTFSTASLWLLKPIWQNISNPMPDHAPTPLQATHNQVKTLLQDVCN